MNTFTVWLLWSGVLALAIVALIIMGGCAEDSGEGAYAAPAPIYDPECRMRIYGEGMSYREKQEWSAEYAVRMTGGDHTMDKSDPSSEEVMEEMGVPYYEMCKVSGGE